ncbi:MAG: sugar ABC transporter permease [Anaerolineae bacterium]|nr:sugar ABC transporter permease [Anaerolineae bacterium]
MATLECSSQKKSSDLKALASRLLSWLERDGPLSFLLTLPSVVWMLGIIGYPVGLVFWLSLHNQRSIEKNVPFVGLDNYAKILHKSEFWESARLTVIWSLGNLLLIVPIGIAIAVVLNLQFYGQRTVRTWSLLPWMFPIVVNVLMWRWILDPVAGVLNYLMRQIGLVDQPVSFFASRETAMLAVILVNAWRWTPFMAVVTLAAMQTISGTLYEAARVDGASSWAIFWRITFPLIRPAVANTAFILVIWLFNMFPPIWLMTQGGPGDGTATLPVLIYKQGLHLFRMSNAATISVLLLVMFIVPFTTIYLVTFGRRKLS